MPLKPRHDQEKEKDKKRVRKPSQKVIEMDTELFSDHDAKKSTCKKRKSATHENLDITVDKRKTKGKINVQSKIAELHALKKKDIKSCVLHTMK